MRLNGGRIARGADGAYFVSVEVDGPGYEDTGDLATWATESTGGGGGAISSADELARTISSWRAAETAGIDVGDPAVGASRACLPH